MDILNSIKRENLTMDIQNTLSHKAKKAAGFTLIELIVTVVIIGIIFAVGVPGMSSLLCNVSQTANADKLVNSLAYARGEAVARVADVSVVAVGGGRVGWNVFIDDDVDCVFDDPGEELLREVDIIADNITITGVFNCVGFNELGENRANAAVSLTIDSVNASVPDAVVSISPSGYARID